MDVRRNCEIVGHVQPVKSFDHYGKGKQGLPSTGIPYVLVNGTIVVSDSKVLKDVYPGQSIRFPVEEKGRFEPSDKEQWLQTYTIDSGGVRPTLIDDITDN